MLVFYLTRLSPRNTNWKEKLSTVNIEGILTEKRQILFSIKRSWYKRVIQGGQLYWAFLLQLLFPALYIVILLCLWLLVLYFKFLGRQLKLDHFMFTKCFVVDMKRSESYELVCLSLARHLVAWKWLQTSSGWMQNEIISELRIREVQKLCAKNL
jgi:hypothetical protein